MAPTILAMILLVVVYIFGLIAFLILLILKNKKRQSQKTKKAMEKRQRKDPFSDSDIDPENDTRTNAERAEDYRNKTRAARIKRTGMTAEQLGLPAQNQRHLHEYHHQPKKTKTMECSYCNSGTNYVCDVPNGCKNGICKKCRESGKAKANYTKTVLKRGWITNQVSFRRKGYQCKKCSTNTSKWVDDGSDIGY